VPFWANLYIAIIVNINKQLQHHIFYVYTALFMTELSHRFINLASTCRNVCCLCTLSL